MSLLTRMLSVVVPADALTLTETGPWPTDRPTAATPPPRPPPPSPPLPAPPPWDGKWTERGPSTLVADIWAAHDRQIAQQTGPDDDDPNPDEMVAPWTTPGRPS